MNEASSQDCRKRQNKVKLQDFIDQELFEEVYHLKTPSCINMLNLFCIRLCMMFNRQYPKWVYSVDLTKTFLFENKN